MKGESMATKRQVQSAVNKSIKHWERMIEWVKTQKLSDKPDPEIMEDIFGESWFGDYCPLCQLNNGPCEICILHQKGYGCEEKTSVWRKLDFALTWRTWLKHADEMLNILKSVQEPKQ